MVDFVKKRKICGKRVLMRLQALPVRLLETYLNGLRPERNVTEVMITVGDF